MTCNMMSFSTALQSYEDKGMMKMKGSLEWRPVYSRKEGLKAST